MQMQRRDKFLLEHSKGSLLEHHEGYQDASRD